MIEEQTRQALQNCEAILQAGGASLDDVTEVGMLLADASDFAGLNEEYARWFPSNPPTRYVAKLGIDSPGLLVSIRMTAWISSHELRGAGLPAIRHNLKQSGPQYELTLRWLPRFTTSLRWLVVVSVIIALRPQPSEFGSDG
jgi:Endoribonuclease L-PSP